MRQLVLLRAPGVCALLAAVALFGAAGDRAAHAANSDELPIAGSRLRDSLPGDALVYLRVPHPFGLFAMPHSMPARASEATATMIEGPRAARSSRQPMRQSGAWRPAFARRGRCLRV